MRGHAASDSEFETFVHASWPSLKQASYALTGNSHDAEDLLQGVLARTYVRWSRVRRDDPVAYVRRALVNAQVDQWRRRQRITEDPTEVPPDESVLSDDLSRVEDRDDLGLRMGLLSPRERAMVVLRYYFDHSEGEVAELMGCSVGTVKSTCSRALGRLRIVDQQEERR